MKKWIYPLVVIIGIVVLAKLVSSYLKKDINKTLKESGFNSGNIFAIYDSLPLDFQSTQIETSILIKDELTTDNYIVSFLVPKNWLNVTLHDFEIYRKEFSKINGVFSIYVQNINNTFLDEEKYISDWKAKIDAIGTNSEISDTLHINSKGLEIILINSNVDLPKIGKTAMLHCQYALTDVSFTINFYSNFNYYISHNKDIDKCIRSLRINRIKKD